MFLIPSFYAMISFFFVFIFMLFSTEYNLLLSVWLILVFIVLINFSATIIFYRSYQRVANNKLRKRLSFNVNLTFVFLLLGFIGIIEYISILSSYFGGLLNFIYLFFDSPHEIRWANTELSNAPFLTYFGWIGFFLFFLNEARFKKKWVMIIVVSFLVFNFLGNLLFVDRTRPFWLLFLMLSCYIYKKDNDFYMNIKVVTYLLSLFFVFVLIGFFIGKIQPGEIYDKIKVYFIGGTLYLSHLIEFNIVDNNGFRLIYPIAKVLIFLGVDIDLPSQILPFYKVPFLTNVGTYLEPAYSDAGAFGLILFVFFHSFILNYICVYSLSSKYIFPKLFWASVCFSGLLSFFVPKINTTFVYLIVVLILVEILWVFLRRKFQYDY